jgi:hypothetical protein
MRAVRVIGFDAPCLADRLSYCLATVAAAESPPRRSIASQRKVTISSASPSLSMQAFFHSPLSKKPAKAGFREKLFLLSMELEKPITVSTRHPLHLGCGLNGLAILSRGDSAAPVGIHKTALSLIVIRVRGRSNLPRGVSIAISHVSNPYGCVPILAH